MEKAFSGYQKPFDKFEKRFSMGYQQTRKRSHGRHPLFVCRDVSAPSRVAMGKKSPFPTSETAIRSSSRPLKTYWSTCVAVGGVGLITAGDAFVDTPWKIVFRFFNSCQISRKTFFHGVPNLCEAPENTTGFFVDPRKFSTNGTGGLPSQMMNLWQWDKLSSNLQRDHCNTDLVEFFRTTRF